ncbi:peptide ABC transporter substrate-binding protein [Lentibacillus amyloliquefaciens]|uniref:Peptide ABC transporter substrate-binding protein n=1 Tax=Lentibacillus amyloliquefaciens TaxID=1472767 RepID=A0A0U4EH14_9BACI|nr:peptide ABC transporter substrate-binding protein [Lentibacillus amyloliquefaciens]ALX49785.1 peptide ABC transporter substrate-binding protein [Lentibacillus amyloliquefaciens]
MKSKKIWLLALALLFALFLAACSGGDDSGSSDSGSDDGSSESSEGSSEGEGSSDAEQVLNFINGDTIPSMDPGMATDEYGIQFTGATMEGLYRVQDGEIVPGIATEHEVSEDGTTWTFTLREDATWSNGDPVTANDFVYSWQRAVDPETGSEYGPYMLGGVVQNATAVNEGEVPVEELGVSAPDDYTLEVQLENPVPYFESLATFPTYFPLNESFVEEQGDEYATSTDTLLFNGPFTLENWDSTASSWELQKNEDYWDAETVQLDKMTFEVVKDPQTAVDLYEQGEIDRAGLSSDLVDQYQSHEDYQVFPEASLFYLKMNQTQSDALANEKMRRAISMAVDKEALVNEILNNGSIASTGFVPQDFVQTPGGEDFREANGDLVTHNPEEATQLWEEGLEEIGKDSVELELLGGDSETAKTSDEYIANQLQENLPGLEVTIKSVPFEQRLDADTNMEYQLQTSGWGPDYMDPYTFLNLWLTDGQNNKMGYSNEEYDQLIEETTNELAQDQEARYQNFLEAEQLLAETAAVAPLYQSAMAQLVRPKIQDVYVNSFGPTYEWKWASVGSGE